MLIPFHPQPERSAVPGRLADPFAEGEPHPLARRAAEALDRRLREGAQAGELDLGELDRPGRGKMFGVLVVEDAEGRVGFLCAFSGMLGERWLVEGFAPPLFDVAERDSFFPAVEARLDALEVRHAELVSGPEVTGLRARLAELTARQQEAFEQVRARHDESRRARQEARNRLEPTEARALHALGQQSRAEEVERRQLASAHRQERAVLEAALQAHEQERRAFERDRAELSRQAWRRIAEGYLIPNWRGETRTVASFYAPEPPPGGVGDCAAPKLLGWAFRQGLKPLALAEFWWGAPPLIGGRTAGEFYPACTRKCGVVLPWMLEGLPAW